MIVGGSFSGLRAQRELSDGFDVTVVDTKEYFEYTPGVLRLYTKPSELRMLTAALPTARSSVVVGEVTEVATNAVYLDDGRRLLRVPARVRMDAAGEAPSRALWPRRELEQRRLVVPKESDVVVMKQGARRAGV